MKHSETLGALAKALSAAQAELKPAAMTRTNPFLKSKYADLGAVIDAARPVMAKHQLAVSQLVGGEPGTIAVETILMHESGEWVASSVSLPLAEERGKSTAQVAGSIVTYLRRYALAAALGIYADEDTDGHVPDEPGRQRPARAGAPPAPPAAGEPDAPLTTKTRGRLFALFAERGIEDPDVQRRGIAAVIGRPVESRGSLTEAEALSVIASLEGKA